MKKYLLLVLSMQLTGLLTNAQSETVPLSNRQALHHIKRVFDNYMKDREPADPQVDKDLMRQSLQALNKVSDPNALELLLDVWLEYDLPDFPNRTLVYRIFKNSRPESIRAVKSRLGHSKALKSEENAQYGELVDLIKQLEDEP